jgi:6-phosphogluconolactonase
MISTRRQFLAGAAALPFAVRSFAEGHAGPRWVLLGTDKGKGIYRAAWNAATGELGKIELAAEAVRPNYFARHPKLPVMYTVNEGMGAQAGVSGYRVDAATGGLTLINEVGSGGDGPCYVSVDRRGRSAVAANYSGGTVAGFGLEADGTLRQAGGVFDCRKNPDCGALGPVKARQEAAHMHCATISPKNDFVLVCNLGEDAIEVFPLHPSLVSSEVLGTPTRVAARAGSGPRHVAFHPNGKWVYCVHELDCTIDIYDWSVVGGKPSMTLREGSVVSTLGKGVGLAGNTGCEVVMGDDGRFLYTCSRGVDEILVYRVDANGLLSEQQRMSCGGKVPRIIAFDPSRRWLVSCNQGGTVAVLAHDARTGRLGAMKVYEAETPMFSMWV